jgi:hypothetical protein
MRFIARAAFAVLVSSAMVVSASGCTGGSSAGSASGSVPAVPAAFKADVSAGADLRIDAKGGAVAVHSGEATVAVAVPPGAAVTGASWRVTPLTEAPAGAKGALCPGVYVDVAGAEPSKPCAIAFALPSDRVTDNTTIVRVSDDGASAEIVPTGRSVVGATTLLTADVDGFSTYTTSEEDAAARDKAAVDRAKARGKQADWTMKAVGTETQAIEGWTFVYNLDLFASGAGVEQTGLYKGTAMLDIQGTYKGPASIVKSAGTISAIGRDQNMEIMLIDARIIDLVTGEPVGEPRTAGLGVMNLTGMGSLDIQAVGPTAKGQVKKDDIQGASPVLFSISVTGEDVQVEINDLGIFGGKILRTTK